MAKKAEHILSIKKITGRSITTLSLLVLIVIGLCVATYIYLTQQSQQYSKQNISFLNKTHQLTRSMSVLQVLEGGMTVAALNGQIDEVEIRSGKILDHLAVMADVMDEFVALTADRRHEIKKVSSLLYEIFDDISADIEGLSERLLDRDTITSNLETYTKFNQDVSEFNSSIVQLQNLYSNVMTRQSRLTEQNQIFYGAIASCFVLLIIFVFFAKRWNNRLVVSLSQLRDGIEKVNDGDFTEIILTAKDEIGATSVLFNEMIERYKDAIIAETEREQTQKNLIGFLEVVSEAADGDLTMKAPVTADAFGSIADAYNLMVESLSDLLMDTKVNASNVGEQSRRLIEIFEDMEMGAEMQSSQVEIATKIVQRSEIAAKEISEKAMLAQQASSLVDEVTSKGSELVSNNIEGMQLIRVTVQVINKKMKSLSERLLEIGTISQLISEIATRTTILAMNASIEASRAGEQGRGFLVISDEIKRLADKSAEATKQINGVVKSIQSEANEVTTSLEEETKTVEMQSRLVQDTGQSFSEIQEAISQSKSVVTEISGLSDQQLEMTRNVESSMKKVSEISELTLQQIKNSATITTGLTEQSSELLKSVDTFRLPEN